jgi:Icc-related predicted phosphoesterase
MLHAGSPGLRDLIRQTGPRLFICGHIHEAAGAERMGRTLVVNAAKG